MASSGRSSTVPSACAASIWTNYDFAAHRKLIAMQPGDVPVTYADTGALERDYGFRPKTDIRLGLRRFAAWYAQTED